MKGPFFPDGIHGKKRKFTLQKRTVTQNRAETTLSDINTRLLLSQKKTMPKNIII